ncbi:arsenate reductase [Aerococcus agrisoli]|uniref:Arsenate reductase n=1 Tax=Aerococcus agrisoli TaxID=2487350 RepID=A0A3N4GER6_9LACT|nr:ArsC/Spx/MgsR family protein [Aerococcus agrisoli]RPA59116.1 arsenate reductase [Aerococcus agrisoli]
MLKIYGLNQCSTTQKVKSYLKDKGLEFTDIIDIRDNPPLVDELALALDAVDGQYTKILNTSGGLYREMGLKDKLKDMDQTTFLQTLSDNGMLVKRPLIVGEDKATAGSKEAFLDAVWL